MCYITHVYEFECRDAILYVIAIHNTIIYGQRRHYSQHQNYFGRKRAELSELALHSIRKAVLESISFIDRTEYCDVYSI